MQPGRNCPGPPFYPVLFSVNLMYERNHLATYVWLLLSFVAAGTEYLYVSRVLTPWTNYVDIEGGRLKAAMGDLYPRWVGTRALLLDGKNPYSPEVSHEIQMAFYGHAVVQRYDQPADKIVDEQRFAYPIYVVFVLAPTVQVAFDKLQTWSLPVLILLVAASVVLWCAVLGWRPSAVKVTATILFVLASPQITQGLRLRQPGFFVGFLLALAAWSLAQDRHAIAGLALSLSTIKPQMAVLPILWFMIWSLGDLPRRWRLPASFIGTLAILMGAGEWMLPGWHRDFLLGMVAYSKYVPFVPLLQLALGKTLGVVIAVILMAGVFAFAWKNRRYPAASSQFVIVLSAFFIGATLALPLLHPFNQVLLLLPLLIILRDWGVLPKYSRFTFVITMAWPWITEIVLLLFPPPLRSMARLPLLPSALVLLVPFLLPLWLTTRRVPIGVG
jgi:glycosyl transferase family 87